VLLEALIFFAAAIALTTLMAVLPGGVRARLWMGLPLGLAALAASGLLLAVLYSDRQLGQQFGVVALVAALITRLALPRWSWVSAQLLAMVVLGALAYIAYAAGLTATEPLSLLGLAASVALLLLEVAGLALSVYYAFEILDVLGRRDVPRYPADPAYEPLVALQVPAYNEPVRVVVRTLESLARLRYPRLLVQVVDNNTPDRAVWRALEEACLRLGPRFQFIHLENWPGYKAGALNEATRRLPPEVEVVGVVDADYEVRPSFLRAVVGYFADPQVAFVQTPQEYRDWQDDDYLRALYYSYRYFFEVSMPARAHRNAIIFAGTMGLIRRSVLDEIEGWNETCITEDAEASLRMLGRGYKGVYHPAAYGQGLMPLTFDGLKKQRFRWALGGVQILRLHWRDLLFPGRLRLSLGQRLHYLLGGLGWFGDLLMMFFGAIMLATAIAVALHHQLPIRRMTGAALVVPVAFLATGLGRALWALRTTCHCSWRDALGALRVWFSLSWVVSVACLRGLVQYQTAFLRTPKRKDSQPSWWRALVACKAEATLAFVELAALVAMLVRAPSGATAALALLLAWQGSVYANAPWASMAAEGIRLTPLRRQYLESAQTTGERPVPRRRAMLLLPAGILLAAVGLLAGALLASPGNNQAPFTGPGNSVITRPPASASPNPMPPATSPPLPSPSAPSPTETTPSTAPPTTFSPSPTQPATPTPAPSIAPSPSPKPTSPPSAPALTPPPTSHHA
jgi:cellulose synthase/poly-beta-1,6-N-acetylglucosamine synthase-like glycosyltransferase